MVGRRGEGGGRDGGRKSFGLKSVVLIIVVPYTGLKLLVYSCNNFVCE